jgi:hypothetical protein
MSTSNAMCSFVTMAKRSPAARTAAQWATKLSFWPNEVAIAVGGVKTSAFV